MTRCEHVLFASYLIENSTVNQGRLVIDTQKLNQKRLVPQVSIVRRHEDLEAADVLDLRNKLQARDAEIAELKAQLRRMPPEGVPPGR